MSELQQRVAAISGASAGIGKAGAMALAAQGWKVFGIGRDPRRSAAAEAEIRAAATTAATVHFIRADLALMAEVIRAAAEIAAATPRLDVLINNAGGVRDDTAAARLWRESEALLARMGLGESECRQ